MKRMIRISTFVFASILGAASMTACGNSNSIPNSQNESAVEITDERSNKAGISSTAADENSNSFLDTPNESAVETADEQSDKAETETSSEVEKSETDDAYAPTNEIMNADF